MFEIVLFVILFVICILTSLVGYLTNKELPYHKPTGYPKKRGNSPKPCNKQRNDYIAIWSNDNRVYVAHNDSLKSFLTDKEGNLTYVDIIVMNEMNSNCFKP